MIKSLGHSRQAFGIALDRLMSRRVHPPATAESGLVPIKQRILPFSLSFGIGQFKCLVSPFEKGRSKITASGPLWS